MADMGNGSSGRHFKPSGNAPGSYGREEDFGAAMGPSAYPSSSDGREGYGAAGSYGAADSYGATDSYGTADSPYGAPYESAYGVAPSSRSTGKSPRKRSKAPFVVGGVLVALVVAIAGVGAAALFSAKDLKAQASEVMQGVSGMSDAVAAQDYASAANAAQEVARIAGEMRDSLSSPLWTVASLVPVYGQDVSSVRAIIGSLDDVASDALVPVTEALAANPPSGLISADKTIDVPAVTQLFATIGDAADAVQTCTDTVSSLPAFHIAKLESTVAPVREKLTEMNDLVQNAADLAPLAGAIFGAEGDRTYLITAQNSAEMRASGGFPGSMGTLRLQGGKIELDEFSKVYDVMAEATSPELGVSEQEISLFGGFMNVARDAGMDPDFTRVADIWATAYEEKTGVHVDGVISVTPAVVQDLLAIAGPITLSDGTVVDGTNATKVLQHDLYWNYLSKETSMSGNGDVADALFAEAADLAFEQFFSGLNSDTLLRFVELMRKGMENRSVMFWLSDTDEQEALSALGCSGDVLTDPRSPAVGTYFSLWIGSKMGWYIDIENEITSTRENADGSRTYGVKTTYRNTATPEIIESAGDYISGYLEGFDRDNLYPELLIYAPTGGRISSFEASNGAQFVETEHKGIQVFHASRPDLRAGESIVCTYEVTTAAGDQEDLTFMSTPTLTSYR